VIHNDDDDDDLCVSCSLLCSLWVMLVCEWSSLPAAVADASGASNQRCHNTDTDVSSSVSTTNWHHFRLWYSHICAEKGR